MALQLKEWKGKEKQRIIREDAIRRSTSTIIGTLSEHLPPVIISEKYGIN
jgi:predicted Holliday junction resolvase-like endonuclease